MKETSRTYVYTDGDITVEVEVPAVYDGTPEGPVYPEPTVFVEKRVRLDGPKE